MQCVANVGEVLQEFAGGKCEVRERDYGIGGAVWEGLEGLFDEGEEFFDCFWGGYYGAWTGEGCGEGGENARLMGEVGC